MLNWLTRYQPVVALLEELGATSALDVGSGWHGLARYWPHPVVQTDLHFDGARPDATGAAGTASYVAATAERLPFPDDAFGYAVSLDTMEHLPAAIRAPFVRELTRVAQHGVIVGYPSGPVAARVDQAVLALSRLTPGMSVPSWLQEHLAQEHYPDRSTFADALPDDWSVTREVRSGNAYLATAQVYVEMLPRVGARVSERLERRYRQRRYPRILDVGPTGRLILLATPEPAGGDGSRPLKVSPAAVEPHRNAFPG